MRSTAKLNLKGYVHRQRKQRRRDDKHDRNSNDNRRPPSPASSPTITLTVHVRKENALLAVDIGHLASFHVERHARKHTPQAAFALHLRRRTTRRIHPRDSGLDIRAHQGAARRPRGSDRSRSQARSTQVSRRRHPRRVPSARRDRCVCAALIVLRLFD